MSDVVAGGAGAAAKILVVDDDDALRRGVTRYLQRGGGTVTDVPDALRALAAIDATRFDVIVSDISMPGMNGIELLRAIRERDLDVPVVLVTGTPSLDTAIDAVELGAIEYLTKPFDLEALRKTVHRAAMLGRMARVKRSAIEQIGETHAGPGDEAGRIATFDRALASMWMAFQPIVRTDGTLFGHEALMRSREPALPHPGAVLDAAESLGRLGALGAHVRALTARAGAPTEAGALFVNLHPRDLVDPALTAVDSPLTPLASRVVLEITERASLGKMNDAQARTKALKEMGFRIAIDDLGAGYAGLESFAALEPEIAKLDMSLVRGLDQHPRKQKIVRTMANLCHDLGILVVAEGVETEAELDAVIAAGCDLAQGYLLAKPGPPFPAITWPERG